MVIKSLLKTFLMVKEPFSDPSFSRLSIIVVFCVPTGVPYVMWRSGDFCTESQSMSQWRNESAVHLDPPWCCTGFVSPIPTPTCNSASAAAAAAAATKSHQLCLTLCNPIDGSLPGSPVPGVLQARTLEWVAISFSNARKCKVKVKSLSCVRLFATPWTAAHRAPLSMGFSRQEYWSGVPLPSPELCI